MILKVNDVAYLVKKSIPLYRVKDMELLKEVKGFWGATSVIVENSNKTVYLTERIKEVEVLDEQTHDEMSDNSIKELTSAE